LWNPERTTEMTIRVVLSGEPPMPPPDADFSFTIDFAKGTGDPRRVFDAAVLLIDGFESLDAAVTTRSMPRSKR
jgi:hypothetical protein